MFKLLAVLVAVLLLSGCKSDDVKYVGHRGVVKDAPENTLASFRAAWEKGAPAVECDVRLSKDNRVMVIHDASTLRTTGVDMAVADTNSWELRKLDAGKYKGEEFEGEKIPFLEEVIDTVPEKGMLVIEVKSGEEILPFMREVIIGSNKAARIVIIGFDLDTMAASKKLMPKIPALLLHKTDRDPSGQGRLPEGPEIVDVAEKNGLDGLVLLCSGITEEVVKAANDAGILIYAYGVDSAAEAERMKSLGLAAMGGDYL